MSMSIFLIAQLLSIGLAGTSPIQSKENIQYISKSENKLLDTFKTDLFIGVIGRPDERNPDLAMVDLYSFKEPKKLSMDEQLCKKFLGQVFGDLKKITLKVTQLKIYTSPMGKTCEAQIEDPNHATKIPERRAIVGFIHTKPYGIVFQLSRKSDVSVQEDTRKFWESLR